ncbi:MBL fold metallo-hydrolase [Alteribacillus sp. HJP-4]|uniref:MBL fold metallo-hydrolase n=1 Tax=Alteribacillus sp. HJP-4 TaxID=2775394 RepID=UPI0035CD0DCF
MKITVVGYWHAFPKKGEAASGYLLEQDHTKVLIDCGSGVVSNLQRYCSLDELDAVVISHYHNDHISDIGALHYFRLLQPYIQKENPRAFQVFGHQDDQEGFQRLSYHDIVKAKPYRAEEPLQIGPFTFRFYRTTHPVPCYAMKISNAESSIFYTADTGYTPELAKAAEGAELLISECSLYKGQDGSAAGHLTSEEAGRLADRAGAPQLLLSHLPHFGEHSRLKQEAKAECPNTAVDLASSGWSKTF